MAGHDLLLGGSPEDARAVAESVMQPRLACQTRVQSPAARKHTLLAAQISASQRSDLFRQGSHSASFSASRATARTPAMSMTSRAIRITERALAAAAKDTAHVAGLSSVAQASATLPDLDYGYDALEPVISAGIMELHHSKHHQTYVNNLNAALEKYTDAEARGDVAAMIALQGAIRFNGGGHINHSLFWKNLAPASAGGGGAPEGELAKRIDAEFGDFEVRNDGVAPGLRAARLRHSSHAIGSLPLC